MSHGLFDLRRYAILHIAMLRADGRQPNELRPVQIQPGFLSFAEGSSLMTLGRTTVLCAATVETRLPAFLKGTGQGWVTAEYAMLPRSTHTRTPREARGGGRASEIQRLVGRSLRAACRLDLLGERTIMIDCDVIQADGGTRTAAVTAAYVALHQAISELQRTGELTTQPLRTAVAATSAGIVDDTPILDLAYEEDSRAGVDLNLVMTEEGTLVEVQGTAEGHPFGRNDMNRLLDLAQTGVKQLFKAQRQALDTRETKANS